MPCGLAPESNGIINEDNLLVFDINKKIHVQVSTQTKHQCYIIEINNHHHKAPLHSIVWAEKPH